MSPRGGIVKLALSKLERCRSTTLAKFVNVYTSGVASTKPLKNTLTEPWHTHCIDGARGLLAEHDGPF